jgi:hypothetical protein
MKTKWNTLALGRDGLAMALALMLLLATSNAAIADRVPTGESVGTTGTAGVASLVFHYMGDGDLVTFFQE